MRQAAGGGVLVTSHEQLLRLDHDARSSRLERHAEGVPWSFFSLLVEYDALPEPLAVQARLDPRLSIVVLAAHVQPASDSAAAAVEAGADKQAPPQPSPLDAFILSLRQTHAASHDATPVCAFGDAAVPATRLAPDALRCIAPAVGGGRCEGLAGS